MAPTDPGGRSGRDDALLPADPGTRAVARELFEGVRDLPLFCPHTHLDPQQLADDTPFTDALALFVTSDHYVLRMFSSQGVPLEQVGVGAGAPSSPDGARAAWRVVAAHWHLFRGTPTRWWIERQLRDVFGVHERLGPDTADAVFDAVGEALRRSDFRPQALLRRFGVELLATTDAAEQPLDAHERLAGSPVPVVPTLRPDAVVDLERPGWPAAVAALAAVTDVDTSSYDGYLAALRERRRQFIALGATATDHGPRLPEARWSDRHAVEALYARRLRGPVPARDAEAFRAHVLMELAAMSCEDGLVMQLHPGVTRDHDRDLLARHGPDRGADVPHPVDLVGGLRELLNAFGNRPTFQLVVFTVDEAALGRELAPMAAHYPALRIGAPWWFQDHPAGMRRHRDLVVPVAGFVNGAGFNDDARSLTSIPVRHEMARRVDCGYLAGLVLEQQLDLDEAHELARWLAHDEARHVYRRRTP